MAGVKLPALVGQGLNGDLDSMGVVRLFRLNADTMTEAGHSMSQNMESWEELPQDLMDDWNPESVESGSLISDAPDKREMRTDPGLPNPLRRPWRGSARDSIADRSTAIRQAFVPNELDNAQSLLRADSLEHEDDASAADPIARSGSRGAGRERGSRSEPKLPKVGDEVTGFRLLLELGRGAFARVFLAEEMNLGCRLVALKVSRAEGEEPRILARLQHPHIVPVHSVYDDPTSGLRLLCMPFLGGANLSQLLQEAWGLAHNQATGQSLVKALDEFSQRLPAAIGQEASQGLPRSRRLRSASPSLTLADHSSGESSESRSLAIVPQRSTGGRLRLLLSRLVTHSRLLPATIADEDYGRPSRQFLRGANGVQASVWIIARLAEGLDHAHDRGLLHRDLKPANVLIAADGTPMLLDFNLAAESEHQESDSADGAPINRAILGGTLPYMSPEHLDAFDPDGSTMPEQVDERSDIYALGLILFEMISGEHPFPEPPDGLTPIQVIRLMREQRRARPVPSIRRHCPDVPPSLDALVAQCLDPDPDKRFHRARDMAEDLRRFLDHLPMKHCPEPSLRERAGKWARRHPSICSSTSIAAAAAVLVVLLGIAVTKVYDGMLGLEARVHFQTLDREFTDTQFLLNTAGRNEDTLKDGLTKARTVLESAGFTDPATASQGGLKGRSSPLTGISSRWIQRLSKDEQAKVKRDLIELLMLEARGAIAFADVQGKKEDRRRFIRRAIGRLDQAERIDSQLPPVLFLERATYHDLLGERELADHDRESAGELRSRTSRDLTLLGTSRLEAGDLTGAERALQQAIHRDPHSLWAWFAMGHCHFEQERYADAVADFSAAVACGPTHAWTHFNLGLSLARAGRPLDARMAYDRAIDRDPGLIEARVNRALVELQLGKTSEALADFQGAVAAGCKQVGVLAALGQTLDRLGRSHEAEALFEKLLASDPRNPTVLVARGMTRLERDPAAAELDFASVLKSHPGDALAHYGMARAIRLQDRASALAHLDTALESDPFNLDALQLRALERARSGLKSTLDDVNRLVRSPTPDRLYNASCALAILGQLANDEASSKRAVEVLTEALRLGFPADRAKSDPDLKPLENRNDFTRVINKFSKLEGKKS